MIQVKICGITNLDDALLCCELGFNAVGFVFSKKSKRYVTKENVMEILKFLPPFIMKVGVFVDESLDDINLTVKTLGLNAIQLHNKNRYFEISQLNASLIIATTYDKIKDNFNDFPNVKFLVDTSIENHFGGTGISFDWNLIDSDIRHKIILAGGINSVNIIQAIKMGYKFFDLSSSVEEYPGKKSHKKLLELHKIINEYRGIYAKN